MKKPILLTDEYLTLLEHEHSKGDWGVTSHLMAERLLPFLEASGTKEFLDYGAGRGTLKKCMSMAKFDVTEYDPAIAKISEPPEPNDFVICLDVLEHVEPQCLHNVLADLKRVVKKEAYFIISLVPSFASLRDGRNAHIMLQTDGWWYGTISKYFNIEMFRCYPLKEGAVYPWPKGTYKFGKVDMHLTPLID